MTASESDKNSRKSDKARLALDAVENFVDFEHCQACYLFSLGLTISLTNESQVPAFVSSPHQKDFVHLLG